MSTNTKKQYNFESTFKDLRRLFGVQLQEFSRQFVNTCEDLEAFLTDFDNNQEKLDELINEWCGTREPDIKMDLNASAAIFLLAFISKIEEDNPAFEGESEDGGPFTSS